MAVGDEGAVAGLEVGGGDAVLAVRVEELLGGCEREFVDVLEVDELAQEVGEVVALGEAGELVGVVQTYVDDSAHACLGQPVEEVLGRGLREADGVEPHGERARNCRPCRRRRHRGHFRRGCCR